MLIALETICLLASIVFAQRYIVPFEPSARLRAYMEKVEKETGRPIRFGRERMPEPGMRAAFQEHPAEIRIVLASDLPMEDSTLEQDIAHEVTHGLLRYARGYCGLRIKRSMTEHECRTLRILRTMVDDIPVNKLMHQEGFTPFSPHYVSVVARETKAALAGEDYYLDFANDRPLRSKFMVSRYVMAWTFVEYFDLDTETKQRLKSFLDAFEQAYPNEFQMATQAKEIIKQHNIFEPTGHREIMNRLLELWGLSSLAEVATDR